MNQPIPEFVSFVPVPCVCDGRVISSVDGSPTFDVSIHRSPLGEFSGTIRAIPMYHSPLDEADLKPNDFVKVFVVFLFDVNMNKFDGVAQNFQSQIIGKYEPEALLTTNIQNPITEKGKDKVVVKNKNSEAGVVMSDNHEITTTPGGAISHTMKAFGAGITKNCDYVRAQNFHRIVSHNPPTYPTREHFGLYLGEDIDDESTRVTFDDQLINYRRFVQQTRGLENWVSTCEGTFAPWVGGNNEVETVEPGKDVLFTRIVNNGSNRITMEQGEIGDEFFLLRIDDVIVGEKMAPTPAGASPGQLGNRFKVAISEKGALEIYAAGKGTPGINLPGFKLQITEDGTLTVMAKDKIVFTHGDTADEQINSIVMSPSSGIAINAQSGFTVNGKKLLNENWITFMLQIGGAGIATSVLPPGSPEPLAAGFIAGLNASKSLPDTTPLGFLTSGIPIPAPGIITQPDVFATV